MKYYRWAGLVALAMVMSAFSTVFAQEQKTVANDTVELRVNTLSCPCTPCSPNNAIRLTFQKKHPNVQVVFQSPKENFMNKVGDNPSEIVYVNYRLTGLFVQDKCLYPLDKYLEKTLGINIANGPTLSTDEYIKQLQKSPKYKDNVQRRVSRMTWDVIRRKCPDGESCPYCQEWGIKSAKEHYHVWAFPFSQVVMGLYYDKTMLKRAGLPNRPPETLEEMLNWALKMTDRKKNEYGLSVYPEYISWSTLNILQSMGGRLMEEDKNGRWWYTFDSDQAVDACYLLARLFLSTAADGSTGAVFQGPWEQEPRIGMMFDYLDDDFFPENALNINGRTGFGPVPAGANGERHPEVNAAMNGISAKITDKNLRDLAWDYIWFSQCFEAKKISVNIYVQQDLAEMVHPDMLIATNHAKLVNKAVIKQDAIYKAACAGGIPEPYATYQTDRCIYTAPTKAINELLKNPDVIKAFKNGDEKTAKKKIKQILKVYTEKANLELQKDYGM